MEFWGVSKERVSLLGFGVRQRIYASPALLLSLFTSFTLAAGCSTKSSFFELPVGVKMPQANTFQVVVNEDESLSTQQLQGLTGLSQKYIDQQLENNPNLDPTAFDMGWWIEGMGWIDESMNGRGRIETASIVILEFLHR